MRTSKEIKAELKAQFPGVKFSVRQDRNSIRIGFDSSVSREAVNKFAGQWEKVSRCEATGDILEGGNNFVFCQYDSALPKHMALIVEQMLLNDEKNISIKESQVAWCLEKFYPEEGLTESDWRNIIGRF